MDYKLVLVLLILLVVRGIPKNAKEDRKTPNSNEFGVYTMFLEINT